MIYVLEAIPFDRLAPGLDIPTSIDRYANQVAEILADNWVRGVGISAVRATDVRLHVRVVGAGTCWRTSIRIDGREAEDEDPDDVTVLNEYRWAAAYVWARGDWAVMQPEEVEA